MRRVGSLALLTALALGLPAVAATAADIQANYPSVQVEPGQTARFPLRVTAPQTERVTLEVVGAPPGWRTTLRGGGFVIGAVTTGPDDPPAVELEVEVPADAPEGTGRVVVRASGPSGTSELVLDLDVVAEGADPFALETDFPSLRGEADATFRFTLTLRNRSAREQSFNLVSQGPSGWTVTARPSAEAQAATLRVDAGGSASVQVEVRPPGDVPTGTYPVQVVAASPDAELRADLSVEITGQPDLRLTTVGERLNARARAGRDTTLGLVVSNPGNAPLEDVTFSSTPPAGWEVSFEPDRIDTLGSGQSQQVTARIRPAADAITGDYAVNMSTRAEGRNSSLELRVAVETSSLWGVVGIVLIVVAVAALFLVFRRFGRR